MKLKLIEHIKLPLLARACGSCLSRIEIAARNQIDSLKDE